METTKVKPPLAAAKDMNPGAGVIAISIGYTATGFSGIVPIMIGIITMALPFGPKRSKP